MLVDIHLFDDIDAESLLLHLPAEIKPDELFVGGVEPESGKHHIILLLHLVHHLLHHYLLSSLLFLLNERYHLMAARPRWRA